jgi:triacylglycerol lipase
MSQSTTPAPIVLVHGILGFNHLSLAGHKIADYFRLVPDALRRDGHEVPDPPQLNPAGAIAERAQDLKDYLLTNNQIALDQPVHLIAHSLGGLDSRYMIARLGMADRIRSLTTIGTPHHGSPIADLVESATEPALNQFAAHLGLDVKAAHDLTTSACAQFNREVPDVPGIRYASIAGRFIPPQVLGKPLGLLGSTQEIVARIDGDNDGLVSINSATFAERPAWMTLDHWEANHFRLINWGADLIPAPAELADASILDAYRGLAARLKG